ncbi:MAG: ParB-like protein [Chthoniobacteraceae bacterium]
MIRATQRSLGFREVDYKAIFSQQLALTQVTPTTDAGITTYDYSAQNNKATDLVGFWRSKDLPILIGPDGKAYITDGHHTTAGYLAAVTAPREVIPGLGHVVLGHIVANYYDPNNVPVTPDDAWWTAGQSGNDAFLYGPNGNQLTRSGDPGYSGLQPILPSTLAMPTVPGKTSMTNDDYRALTWGMADGIVKSATNAAGTRLTGYAKGSVANPDVDTNFVEFSWADFLRNRILWDNTKTGSALSTTNSDRNLIEAPLSFFAAVANGIALAKSEVYRDQYGRTLLDYNSTLSSPNTKNWASDSTAAGRLAKATDKFNIFLLDDSTIQGDITPSFLSRANNKLHIDTTAGQTIAGVIANFGSTVDINKGSSIDTQWKDSALNKPAFNSTLTIAAGTGIVTLTAVNTYTGTTSVGAGKLVLTGAGSIGQSSVITISVGAEFDVSAIAFALNAPQKLVNNGTVKGDVDVLGTIGGSGIFQDTVTTGNGAHIAAGNSPGTLNFSDGLTLGDGTVLDFDLGLSSDLLRITGGILDGSGPGGTTVNFIYAPDFVPDSTFTLMDWTGATATDLDLSDFVFTNAAPTSFAIVGNTLQVTVVPEPGITGLLGLSLAAVFSRRRRA